MRKIREIKLSYEERAALESGFRFAKSHALRQRCQLVLLKSEGRSSKELSGIVKMNEWSINNWLTRYEAEGMAGLEIKPGRGRKPVLDAVADLEKVREAVVRERQRLGQAKLLIEKELGKEFCLKTLRRFLKKLSAATDASGKG
jgi:transposase